MRRLRLLWNRVRPILCSLGWHRFEGMYAGGRPHGLGSGKYAWVETCLFCGEER